ncbi:Hypothetical predicted protein [Xyrichtys novacula]|uniref:Uncharacterized protein n=1 Tax=Xyrichtys novacula TaxID=13765 RepID=A0AAV1GAY4_XYRNO|nr:Hypothetical predicted protein [Xyrichtys novacula]
MAAIRNSSPGSNSENAGGSSQPSPASKPQPSEQSSSASPGGSSSSLDWSQSPINPYLHTPSSSSSGGQKGRKRKLDDVDGSSDETCKSPKRVKSGHSSQHGADKAQMITPKRDQPVPPHPNDHNTTRHSSLSQAKVKDRSGLKRKAARDEDEDELAKIPACQSTSCSSQHATDIAQTITPLKDHHVHPVQQNTDTQERKRKRARSGNGFQQTDPDGSEPQEGTEPEQYYHSGVRDS